MLDPGRADEVRARRLLQRYGVGLTFDLLDHKRADLLGKGPANEKDLQRLRAFRKVVEREKTSAHRLRDLAIGGDDLIEIGYKPGPPVGHTLRALLEEVVRDPAANTREHLLKRARELK
jgi:tRNA nucleotidyltransferase (CCA-adding enzyme)